jgi:glycosyltransferase involved in cell wall biosynthesis
MGARTITRLDPVAGGTPRPFWSVVIPTLERPTMLREALASVLAQDPGPEHMEILVHEDFGEESAGAVVTEFDGRVRHLRAPRRLGQIANVNAAIAATRGAWIHLLHDDDWVAPGFYDGFRRLLADQDEAIGGGLCGQINVTPSGERIALDPVWDKAGPLLGLTERLIRANPISPVALVVRRAAHERIGLYREDLRFTSDWEFMVRLSAAYHLVVLPERLAFYREHEASVTGSRRWVDQAREIDGLVDEFAARSLIAPTAIEGSRANLARNFARRSIARAKAGDGDQAFDLARAALMIDTSPETHAIHLYAAGMRQADGLRDWMFEALRARVLAEAGADAPVKPAAPPMTLAPIANDGKRPFWSVVIPAFGRPEMLRQALRSVLAQDPGPEHMEIIVHEDHGEETASAIAAEFNGRVRHVRAERGLGAHGVMNAGLSRARGVWTHLLHDDDWVAPDFYATFRRALEGQPDRVGAALCGQNNVPARGEPYRLSLLSEAPGVLANFTERVLRAHPISPVALVVRRAAYERVGLYRDDPPFTGDMELVIRLGAAFEVFFVPRHLAYHRIHDPSITGSIAHVDQARELARLIDALGPAHGLPPEAVAVARADQATAHAVRAAKAAGDGDGVLALSLARAALAIDASRPMHRAFLRAAIHKHAQALRSWMLDGLRARAREDLGLPMPASATVDPSRQPPRGEPPAIAPIDDDPTRPFWSVVIPTYRRVETLRVALRSVLADDPGPVDLEIIVAQGHWEECVEPVIREFATGRIRLLRAPVHLGQARNWNAGIEAARGRWIHLLHDDDWVAPGFHATMRAVIEPLDASFGAAACASIHAYPDKPDFLGVLLRERSGPIDELAADLVMVNRFTPPSVVIRRAAYEAVGGFWPAFPHSPDWELYLRVLGRFRWWYEARHLAYYRRHATSQTGTLLDSGVSARDARRLIDHHARHLGLSPARRRGALTN